MNISTLEHYVEQRNAIRALFREPKLSLLNAKDRQQIANDIDCALSPENLTCDGELRPSQWRAKYDMLMRCAEELKTIDSTVVFYEV